MTSICKLRRFIYKWPKLTVLSKRNYSTVNYQNNYSVDNSKFKYQLNQYKYHNENIYTIDNFLNDIECKDLLSQSHKMNFEEATVDMKLKRNDKDDLDSNTTQLRKDIRNNERIIFENKPLAHQLYQRLQLFNLPIESVNNNLFLNSLNDRFKIYKYSVGQQFKLHRDGIFINTNNNEESRYTILIYLNQNFKGGETQFVIENKKIIITPKLGSALIFYHNLKHAGLPVIEGNKYALRSDVMYKK
jgi:hypothetical protein